MGARTVDNGSASEFWICSPWGTYFPQAEAIVKLPHGNYMVRRFRNASGPRIRQLRLEKGWTQDQLAARLVQAGLGSADRVVVAKIESQIRSVFDFELVVIGQALGVAGDSLLPTARQLRPHLEALCKGEKPD